ncbi:RDD family protein [Aquisphaera giovannonii]|uniref:RDD family protein n=1 Tax=Aquisphaera giovannonii TaxID=406548 RepID=A0A5B9W0S2_9BACT|nr:RDD family protein [Aquisphaera giovannonii]QEH33510.1 RDD family protein [Aquisphaera giovannonii]
MSLDGTVVLETPERIAFSFPLAGPFRRLPAYLIDVCILGVLVLAALVFSVSLAGPSGLGLGLVLFFLFSWGYGAFFEGLFNGRTPGKHALGLRVVSEHGVPVRGPQAVLRNLIGSVDGPVPFAFLLGLTSMFVSPKFQRLGDLAAGTMVIVEERRPRIGLIRIDEQAVLELAARLPARIAAGPSLSLALSDYASRRLRFGDARREEIAEPLARPLRARLGLPPSVPADLVLCAAYHRIFLEG